MHRKLVHGPRYVMVDQMDRDGFFLIPVHSFPLCFDGFLGVEHKLPSRLCYLHLTLVANLKYIAILDEMICWPHTFTHTH